MHVWSRSIDGAEFANTLYENEIDAALAFCAIAQQVRKYSETTVTIEEVMRSLEEGNGMYVGVPGLVFVLSRCSGGCISPTWN